MRGLLAWVLAILACADELVPASRPAATSATAAVFSLRWDRYRSLIVIGDAVGVVRPAWVLTYELPFNDAGLITALAVLGAPVPPALAVAYRALAWTDASGSLHVDARGSTLSGPQAGQWIPDSFIIPPHAQARTNDDQQRGHPASVERVIPANDPRYLPVLQRAQQTVADGS